MSRNQAVKKRRINKRKRRKRGVLIVFLLFVVSLLCGLSLTVFFPVKEITATESNFYSSEQIINNCGIVLGENLLRISESRVLDTLQKELPFVDDIKISKKLPSTVEISVTDAAEIYVFKIGDIYYSTDDQTRVLKTYSTQPENLLFVNCKIAENTDLKHVTFENEETKEIIGYITKYIETFPLKADYIDLTNLYAIEMGFDSRFTVNFGEFTYFEQKLAHFLKMLEEETFAQEKGEVNLSQYNPDNPQAYFIKKD